MKKFFKSWVFKLIIWCIILILSVCTLIISIDSNGANYTTQYTAYKSVKDICLLNELKEYCIENNIHYFISNSEIKIFPKTKDEIKFNIVDDTVFLEKSTRNTYFELLENGKSSEISVSTYKKGGKLFEKSSIISKGTCYTFTNGKFYLKELAAFSFVMIFTVICISVSIFRLICVLDEGFKKRKNDKIKISKRQSDSVDDSKIQG